MRRWRSSTRSGCILIEAADRAGISSYHLAEHHWNPVGMAPLPGVFLGAVAMRTKRIKFGPLSYASPSTTR